MVMCSAASRFHYLQTRNLLEVTRIAGDASETRLQCSSGDQQIFERDSHTLRCHPGGELKRENPVTPIREFYFLSCLILPILTGSYPCTTALY
jgi:hypothetical protein